MLTRRHVSRVGDHPVYSVSFQAPEYKILEGTDVDNGLLAFAVQASLGNSTSCTRLSLWTVFISDIRQNSLELLTPFHQSVV